MVPIGTFEICKIDLAMEYKEWRTVYGMKDRIDTVGIYSDVKESLQNRLVSGRVEPSYRKSSESLLNRHHSKSEMNYVKEL